MTPGLDGERKFKYFEFAILLVSSYVNKYNKDDKHQVEHIDTIIKEKKPSNTIKKNTNNLQKMKQEYGTKL